MRYELIPGVGVNDVKFGMSRDEADAIMGQPKRLITYGENFPIVKERWEGMDCSFLLDRAVECMFFEETPGTFPGSVVYKNIDLFKDKDVIWKLGNHDTPEMCINDRYVMYANLGIMIGGFGKIPIFEGRHVILFAPERKEFWYRFLVNNPYRKIEEHKKREQELRSQIKAVDDLK